MQHTNIFALFDCLHTDFQKKTPKHGLNHLNISLKKPKGDIMIYRRLINDYFSFCRSLSYLQHFGKASGLSCHSGKHCPK